MCAGRQPAIFVLHGAHVARRRMGPGMVVEPDPIQNHLPCLGCDHEPLTVNTRRFQMIPQTLGWSIVPAISLATHRADNALLLEC